MLGDDDAPAAAPADFSLASPPPPRRVATRLIVTGEFVVPDACREWNVDDASGRFYDDVASTADADRTLPAGAQFGQTGAGIFAESAFDASVACPAVFVDDGIGGRRVIDQSFRLAPISQSAARGGEQSKTTVGRNSDVTKPTVGIVDVMPADSCDTTGLLSALCDDRAPSALKPNRYSSIW